MKRGVDKSKSIITTPMNVIEVGYVLCIDAREESTTKVTKKKQFDKNQLQMRRNKIKNKPRFGELKSSSERRRKQRRDINFREGLFAEVVVVLHRLSRLCNLLLLEPNLRDNFRLCLRLPEDLLDIHIDIRLRPDEGYPSFLSFDHGLRSRMPVEEVAFWERWRDNVGYPYVDIRYLGSNGFVKGTTEFLLPASGSVHRPTIY